MNELQRFGLVFVGAGMGGVARHLIQSFANQRWPLFPWGTLVINVVGSLLIGLYFGWETHRGPQYTWRLLLPTGILGGFTTFSAFSYETMTLLESGRYCQAAGYMLGSVTLSLAACALGITILK